MSNMYTPSVLLRSQVVSRVVLGIIGLTILLYGACIALIGFEREVPGELWLAAGNASGALFALLVNSKNDPPPPGTPGSDPILIEGVPGGEPVVTDPVENFPEEPEPDPTFLAKG